MGPTMRALVYQGPGKMSLEPRPMPQIQSPTDAIIKITRTTICGTDLHILKGDLPACAPYDTFGRAASTRALKVILEA
jgi:alcohol dehydrogenase